MREPVEVREAREADWLDLEMIFRTNRADDATWLDPGRPKDNLREQSKGEKILVAEIGRNVVGFVAVWEPENFIHHLYVDIRHQGKGIGRKLVLEAQERCSGPMRLKCVERNSRAMEFYFGSGWKELERGESVDGPCLLLELRPGPPSLPDDIVRDHLEMHDDHPGGLRIRLYRESDAERTRCIFRDVIRARGPEQYDSRQVAAWAAAADDPPSFHLRLARGFTVVAEREGDLVGFAQLFPPDVVEMMYCDPGHVGSGIGGRLLAALEQRAASLGQTVLDTRASLLARPFFEKHGYHVLARETVTRAGVEIPRIQMRKVLPDPSFINVEIHRYENRHDHPISPSRGDQHGRPETRL